MIEYNKLLSDICGNLKKNLEGNLANYIPELGNVDPSLFAVSITTIDGSTYSYGDKNSIFTLQSTSKPFMYGMALTDHGINKVHEKIGVEPTGEAFNSIIELETETHRPFNPMINSGAIAIASMIKDKSSISRQERMKELFSTLCNRNVEFNESVFLSEKNTAHRNRAIANLLRHFEVIGDDIEESLDLYFKQCSVNVNVNDLSMMAATLANNGIQPLTKKTIYTHEICTKIIALMFTCGMYDTAGTWAFNVGIPAKSGVSGAVFAVVPNKLGIACYSPLINNHGHSIKSLEVITKLTRALNFNIFN